jgi:hypothetical protein
MTPPGIHDPTSMHIVIKTSSSLQWPQQCSPASSWIIMASAVPSKPTLPQVEIKRQRIFSIDNKMVQEVIEKITLESLEALRKVDSLSKDFNKIIDINGHHAILPTESGLPIHFYHQNPLRMKQHAK